MATAALIPVSEYLNATYHPDCDYVDGEVRERNMGEESHGEIQAILARIFGIHRKEWGVRVYTEVRVQTSETHFRIPDVCIVPASRPRGRVIRYAPMICIEILSPEDRIIAMMDKVEDYSSLGVANIWVIDPEKRVGYYATGGHLDLADDGVLRVEESEIAINLADVFAELDEK